MLLFVLTPWILTSIFTAAFVLPFWSSSEVQRRGDCTGCGPSGADVRPVLETNSGWSELPSIFWTNIPDLSWFASRPDPSAPWPRDRSRSRMHRSAKPCSPNEIRKRSWTWWICFYAF